MNIHSFLLIFEKEKNECSFIIAYIWNMNKKELILRSVLKLVNKEGFYHLNMKKIAAESGVAAGTIYLYFQGKEEMINAIYEQVISEFNQQVLNAYQEDADFKSNFEALLTAATLFYIEHEDKFSFIEQFTFSPFLFKENKKQNFTILLPVYKLLDMGIKAGILKNKPLEILLAIIHGSMNTMIKLHYSNKYELKDEKNMKNYIDTIWECIKT